jgi:hypothetical protein
VEGWGIEWVEKGVHNSVGNSGDVVPSKGWNQEGEVDLMVGGGEKREDESIGVGGGKAKGPVKVGDVSTVEEDGFAGTEGRFKCVEVWEREVFGKEGE